MHRAKKLASFISSGISSTKISNAIRSSLKAVPLTSSNLTHSPDLDDSKQQLVGEVTSMLSVVDSESPFENSVGNTIDILHFSKRSKGYTALSRKKVSREKKHKWVSKNSHDRHFREVVLRCGQKIGADATLHFLHSLGREAGVKEYNAFIGMCVEQARNTKDDEVSIKITRNAFQIFKIMQEKGHELGEATYSPLLLYLIDMGMIDDFQYFCEVLENENPSSCRRLGYYRMLFWSRANNEEKIQELCAGLSAYDAREKSSIAVNYMSALFQTGHEIELLQLLEVIDISELDKATVTSVFKLLGGLTSDSYAEKFMLACKSSDYEAEDVCEFILNYVINIPYLPAEDMIVKFKYLHKNLEVVPTSDSYEKLIAHLCALHKVHAALDIVKEVLEAGMTLGIWIVHSLLQECDESGNFNLVSRIYPLICQHNLKLNNETFRITISLSVKMKDFEGAYNMLKDLNKVNLEPTASLYNVIILGYFREKNFKGALMVVKQMELANVKPDAQTFSYLISNCDSEEDIIKYYEEMKNANVSATKQIFMALINAYANCGQFDKAKQVVQENGIVSRCLYELKSVLVAALASNKQVTDAIAIYEEIKEARGHLEAKATMHLIEYIQSEGELSRLLQLLNDFSDPLDWVDGCCRVILYCVRYRQLSSAVDLLKQLKDKLSQDELTLQSVVTQAFVLISDGEVGKTDIQFGLNLLGAIKKDLGLSPSRRDLELLLAACVDAKDSKSLLLVWEEHKAAGLPYNVLSYLRMYQALLACGEHKAAENMLCKIPTDDPHVRSVIDACQTTYKNSPNKGKKKKTKTKTKKKEAVQ